MKFLEAEHLSFICAAFSALREARQRRFINSQADGHIAILAVRCRNSPTSQVPGFNCRLAAMRKFWCWPSST